MNSCQTCSSWNPLNAGLTMDGLNVLQLGECRRFPPWVGRLQWTKAGMQHGCGYPHTEASLPACGEYQARSGAAVEK
jgi:hypothetical protein